MVSTYQLTITGDIATAEQHEGAINAIVAQLQELISELSAGMLIVGNFNASGGVFPTTRPDTTAIQQGDVWIVVTGGTVDGQVFTAGDRLVALKAGGGATFAGNWLRAPFAGAAPQIALDDGTAAAPSVRFISDSSSGLYRRTDGRLGFSIGGVAAAALGAGGALELFGAFTAPSAAIAGALTAGSATVSGTLTAGDIASPAFANKFVNATLPLLSAPPLADGALTFLGRGASKLRAVSRVRAIAMTDDHSGMAGYAAQVPVTGGAGKPVFWVTNGTDNKFDPEAGSLRAATDAATAAGGGRILVDPLRPIDIYLEDEIVLPANATLDAPGRNCRIIRRSSNNGLRINSDNCIVRRIHITVIPDNQSIPRDCITCDPFLCHSFWFYENTIEQSADGATDIASINELLIDSKGTIGRCIYRNVNKTMLIGSLACFQVGSQPSWCPIADTEPSKLFVTIHDNIFEHTGQRNPSITSQCFAHVHGNVYRLTQQDEFGSDTIEFGGAYGTRVGTGGMALSEHNLYTIANDTGFVAVDSILTTYVAPVGATPGTQGPGNVKSVGDVVMNGMTVTERNTTAVPIPPYTLPTPTLIDTPAGRDARMAELYAIVGAEMNPFEPLPYRWDSASAQIPDGNEIVAVNNDVAGRFLKQGNLEYLHSAPSTIIKVNQGVFDTSGLDILFKVDLTRKIVTHRATRIPRESSVTLAADTLTIATAAGYYTVSNEAGASTDNLSTITITPPPQDGQEIRFMPSSTTGTLVIKHNVGNIILPGGVDKTLNGAFGETATLFWAEHRLKWVLRG